MCLLYLIIYWCNLIDHEPCFEKLLLWLVLGNSPQGVFYFMESNPLKDEVTGTPANTLVETQLHAGAMLPSQETHTLQKTRRDSVQPSGCAASTSPGEMSVSLWGIPEGCSFLGR